MEGYVALGVIAGIVIGILFWVGLVIWTYRDIKDRTRDIAMQILSLFLVMIFAPLGLPLYLLMRPRETLDESYGRSIEEEVMLREIGEDNSCPSCRRFTDKSFVFCPYCQTRLQTECLNCSCLLSISWTSCPKCGTSKNPVVTQSPIAKDENNEELITPDSTSTDQDQGNQEE